MMLNTVLILIYFVSILIQNVFSALPKSFHNYGNPNTGFPYDTQSLQEQPLQNVPAASISFVPVQAASVESLVNTQSTKTLNFILPKALSGQNAKPQSNGHFLKLQQGLGEPATLNKQQNFEFPQQWQSTKLSKPGVFEYTLAEQGLNEKREREVATDSQRRSAALEEQKAKIFAKQQQLLIEKQIEKVQKQNPEQKLLPAPHFPAIESQTLLQHSTQPTVKQNSYPPNNNLSMMSNHELEEYAQRLRFQLLQENTHISSGSLMAPTSFQTMATTAPTTTPALVPLTEVLAVDTSEKTFVPVAHVKTKTYEAPFVPPKNTHEINYCNRAQFDDIQLENLHLKRIEYFIYNTSCSGTFFQCAINQTFSLKCPSDDGQAFDPAISSCNFKNSVRFCPEFDHVLHCTIRETCSSDQFACCAMPQKCIDYSRRCDGHKDCSDGEDENNCPSCAKNEFACVKSGICISAKKRCDGQLDDCGDGTNLDEIGCSRNETCWGKFACDSEKTISEVGHSVCIDFEKHCNRVRDCPGGEDEINCRLNETKYLSCENQKQSVRKEQWCDAKEDCADGSDEKYCF